MHPVPELSYPALVSREFANLRMYRGYFGLLLRILRMYRGYFCECTGATFGLLYFWQLGCLVLPFRGYSPSRVPGRAHYSP